MAYDVGQGRFQIVPSFTGVAQAIQDEARKWGVSAGSAFANSFSDAVKAGTAGLLDEDDEGAKKGSSAGGKFADAFKARVDAALKTLPDADVGINSTDADAGIAELREKLATLRNQRIGIDIPPEKALAELAEIKLALAAIGKSSESIDVKVNTANAITEIVGLETEVKTADSVLKNLGNGGPNDISAIGDDAESAGVSIGSVLVPALVAVGLALIPIAGLAGGALTTLPAIFGGLGVGVAAIAIALPAIKSAISGVFDPLVDQLTPFVEGAILPGLVKGLQDTVPLFQAVEPFIVGAAKAMGDLATNVGAFLGSATGISETNSILSAGSGFLKQMGNNALTLLQAFGSIGSQAQPIVTALGNGITDIVNAFAKWAEGNGLQTFLTWLRANGPAIVGDLGAFVKGAGQLIVALTPVGVLLLKLLTPLGDLLGFLGKSPALLGAVSLALGGFGIALAIALDSNPIGLIITAIGLLVIGIDELVTHWSTVWSTIKTVFDDALSFLRSGLGTALVALILAPIAPLVLLALHWQQVAAIFEQGYNDIVNDVFDPLVNFFTQTIPHAFDNVVSFLSGIVGEIGNVISGVAGALEKPFQDAFSVIESIVNAIKAAIDFITQSKPAGTYGTPGAGGSPSPTPGRAVGGPVSGGSPYLVGELGPELVVPNSSGTVIPNSGLRSIDLSPQLSGGPIQAVGEQHFHNEADIDGLTRQLSFMRKARRL